MMEDIAESTNPCCELNEGDWSMEAVAEVLQAIAVADIGRGWLWVPS